MNIIDELEAVFSQYDLDDFSRIRYIYLYVCTVFSYDSRYYFAVPEMKNEIYNKELDVKNIQEFEIVCYTYSKILLEVLDHFGYRAEIRRDFGEDFKDLHAYVVVYLPDRLVKLDPTKKHDTARVKMNAGTYDFIPLIDDSTFEDDMREADDYIRRIKNSRVNYRNGNNFHTMDNYLAFLSKRDIFKEENPDDVFYNKLNAIITVVNTRRDFTRYDDMDYFLSYLLRKNNVNYPTRTVYCSPFFKIDDPELKTIINIMYVNYHDNKSFYVMRKVEGQDYYHISSSNPEEVLELLSQYENLMNDYFFEKAAKQAIYERNGRIIC